MSRPRSASSRPAAARAGRPGVFVQTPKSDIYVVMLSIALGAMFLGSLLLVLILGRYDFKVKAAGLTSPSRAISVAHSEIPTTVRL